jgi:hypothetical protein
LQVIDIPHQAEVDSEAFENCHLLIMTLEEHGKDCMKGRFDALPIHQSYYKLNYNTSQADNDSIMARLIVTASSTTSTFYKTMIQLCYR